MCVQVVHSLILSFEIKSAFDLFDMPTGPTFFEVAVYSYVSHKRINYQTTITDDSCLSLVYRKKDSEMLIFWQCLGNDIINLCCGKVPLFIWPLQFTWKWPFRAVLTSLLSHLKGVRTLSVWEDDHL